MKRENIIKFNIGLLIISTMSVTSCNTKTTADKNKPTTQIEETPQYNPESFIADIDEYVYFIRQHGENFSIERQKLQKPANSSAVVCKLDGQTVKISILSDSSQTDMVDLYMRDSKLVYMSKNGIQGSDCPNDNVYYLDGKIYKCFRDGNEINNRDSINTIGDVSQYASVF